MIYRVVLDGNDIYSNYPDMTLLNPKVDIKLNEAGSCDFTMPYNHKYYDSPHILTSDVEVYEDGDLIWYGRVLENEVAMNKNKTVSCEGAFAFFIDSIQRPYIFEETTVHAFFRYLVSVHNGQVPENRQFIVGEITVDDKTIYRELNYETTKDAIQSMCLDAEGGYLVFRKSHGVNYVDWLTNIPYIGSQPIQFGLNITDISNRVSGANVVSVILPLGKEIDGTKLTITEINDGHDWIENPDAVALFGRITKVVEFSDIGTRTELKNAAQNWLNNQSYEPFTINCSAAELHYLDGSYTAFRTGQLVQVTSTPHLINKVMPITSINISLDSPVKNLTVGTQEKRDLSEITKPSY